MIVPFDSGVFLIIHCVICARNMTKTKMSCSNFLHDTLARQPLSTDAVLLQLSDEGYSFGGDHVSSFVAQDHGDAEKVTGDHCNGVGTGSAGWFQLVQCSQRFNDMKVLFLRKVRITEVLVGTLNGLLQSRLLGLSGEHICPFGRGFIIPHVYATSSP